MCGPAHPLCVSARSRTLLQYSCSRLPGVSHPSSTRIRRISPCVRAVRLIPLSNRPDAGRPREIGMTLAFLSWCVRQPTLAAKEQVMVRSLLVPLDGSPFGEHALPYALHIARRTGATLHLLNVLSPIASLYAEAPLFIDDHLEQ